MSEDPHHTKGRCMTCNWYSRWPHGEGNGYHEDQDHGQCRINTPVQVSGPYGSWPHVNDTDWCKSHDLSALQYEPIKEKADE